MEGEYGWQRLDLLDRRSTVFPYLDYRDIRQGIDAAGKDYAPTVLPSPSWARRVGMQGLARLGGSGPVVGLLAWGGIGPGAVVIGRLLAAGHRLAFPDYAPLPQLPFEPQWEIFARLFDAHAEDLGLSGARPGLLAIIRNHMRARIGHGERPLACDLLVSKFLSHLPHRTTAVQARRQGKPVVAISFSDAEADQHLPIFGYGERTFATHTLGYGRDTPAIITANPYMHSLFEQEDKIRHRSGDSPMARRLYRPQRPIRRFAEAVGKKLFYVPTGMSGLITYGPFRMLPDILYARWRQRVMAQFPEAILKAYPHDGLLMLPDLPPHRLITRPFEAVVEQADGFIFDHISTALHIACMTDKPIILCAFPGVDNAFPAALEALQARCIHLPIHDLEDDTLRERAMAQANDDKTNPFTPAFSLSPDGTSRIDALLSLLKEM